MEGTFPKVEVPGLEVDELGATQVAALIENDQHIQREKQGMALAMFRTGKGFTPRNHRGRKAKAGITKHVRHMRRVASRSQSV